MALQVGLTPRRRRGGVGNRSAREFDHFAETTRFGKFGLSFAVRRRSSLVLHAAIGTPALPLPVAVHAPAEEASRKVFQVPDPKKAQVDDPDLAVEVFVLEPGGAA
jgi:hypothetical protein